jgi:hypothetical protein
VKDIPASAPTGIDLKGIAMVGQTLKLKIGESAALTPGAIDWYRFNMVRKRSILNLISFHFNYFY